MKQCDRCGTFIMDFEENFHLMVDEGDTPDKAYFWCDDCYNEVEL